VRSFYQQNFCAGRTHVYVAGVFDAGKMEEAIRKAFADWQRGTPPVVNIPSPSSKRMIYLVDRPGAPQSTIYLGLPVLDPSKPDYRAMLVTNALLGGSFASRITSNIREQKGYTYSPFSTVSPRYRDAYWLQVADVSTAVTGASLKEIFYEIDRLRTTPPAEEELKGIQNYLAGVFVLQNSSPEGIIGQISFLDLHNLPERYIKEAVKDIYAVTPEKVRSLTDEYIRPQDMTIVIVGDKQKIEKQVTPFGKIAG
jgi:predicted Zn-dependent peptidase